MKKAPKNSSYHWTLTVLSVTAIAIMVFVWYAPNPIQAPPDQGPPWDQVRSTLEDLTPTMQQVETLIKEGRVLRAERLMNSELRPIWSGATKYHADQSMNASQTLAEWVDQQEALITSLIHKHFLQVIERITTGDMDLESLQAWLREKGDSHLTETLASAEASIISLRSEAATNWYRVVFLNSEANLLDPAAMEKFIRRKARNSDQLKLVFGPALSEEEQNRTWNTLMITGQVQTAAFTAELNNSFNEQNWTPSPVTIGTSWYMKELRPDHPTTWKELDELHVWFHPPRKISKNLEKEIQQNYLQRIRSGIQQRIASWPAFAVEE